LAPNNSYGKSGTATFLEGGVKYGAMTNLGKGHSFSMGLNYEVKAPTARTSFQAAQVSNDFVKDLTHEKIFSAEMGYRWQTSWMKANLNAYYSYLTDVTEQNMYYMDNANSFVYVTVSGIEKVYYGLELGIDFKLTDWLDLKALGTISDAKYDNNAKITFWESTKGTTDNDELYNKGMHEGCTPLTAGSLDFSIHTRGWYIDLIGNYYDRIYLYYTPVTRLGRNFPMNNSGTGKDLSLLPDQAKGKGGFMLDASIGRTFFLNKGRRLGFNLMLTNILNNQKLVFGGREQSRVDLDQEGKTFRTYSFQNNPYKFYAQGINGMFMINYQF